MRLARPISALLLATALGIGALGCGGDDGEEAASPLDEALGYLPEDAPFAVAISTDIDGDQYQALGALVERFPFGAQVREQIQTALEAEEEGDYTFEEDLRPLLGNEFVVGAPTPDALADESEEFIGAIQVADADKLQELSEQDADAEEAGEVAGATIYEEPDGDVRAIKDDVLVVADTRETLEAALEQREADDRLTEDTFDDGLGDLPEDALVRLHADMQQLISTSPEAEQARSIEWVAALGSLGLTISAEAEGLAIDFAVTTEDDLAEEDLPLASGDEPAPVTAAAGDLGVGIRDPSQIVEFTLSAGQTVSPEEFGEVEGLRTQLQEQLDLNLDDLINEFSGPASVSVGLDGAAGFVAGVEDPAAVEEALAKLAEAASKRAGALGLDRSLGLEEPGRGEELYGVATPGGQRLALGVVEEQFVVAQDPDKATELASQAPSVVSGAQGSLTFSADAEAVVREVVAQQAAGPLEALGAGIATGSVIGPLGDLTSWLQTELDGMRGQLRLEIE